MLSHRAILRNPSLLLCDEVTSSVDAVAEREIISCLRDASAQRTTVTVAHRLSSIMHSDLILVLSAGHIVEQGTHAQLMAIPCGVYRDMWNTQHHSKQDTVHVAAAAVQAVAASPTATAEEVLGNSTRLTGNAEPLFSDCDTSSGGPILSNLAIADNKST